MSALAFRRPLGAAVEVAVPGGGAKLPELRVKALPQRLAQVVGPGGATRAALLADLALDRHDVPVAPEQEGVVVGHEVLGDGERVAAQAALLTKPDKALPARLL